MKIKVTFLTIVMVITLFVQNTSSANAQSGSFYISSSNSIIKKCFQGDIACTQFTQPVTFINHSPSTFHQMSIWESDPLSIIEFKNKSGAFTSSVDTFYQALPSGSNYTTDLRVTVDSSKLGTKSATLYGDGKVCNFNVTPADCIAYGGSSFSIQIEIIPQPSNVDINGDGDTNILDIIALITQIFNR